MTIAGRLGAAGPTSVLMLIPMLVSVMCVGKCRTRSTRALFLIAIILFVVNFIAAFSFAHIR
jgi:hypothetical protein